MSRCIACFTYLLLHNILILITTYIRFVGISRYFQSIKMGNDLLIRSAHKLFLLIALRGTYYTLTT